MGGPIKDSDSKSMKLLPARIVPADWKLGLRNVESVWKDVGHSIYGTWVVLMLLFGAADGVIIVNTALGASWMK